MIKVLVIEDNMDNLYMMRFILKKLGHQIIEAHDGAKGVELAIAEKPDLIFMDIQLPVMDGYEATKKIREYEEIKDTPIIAVTSFVMPGDREKTLQAGCTDYIEKPINPEFFIQKIQSYIEKIEEK